MRSYYPLILTALALLGCSDVKTGPPEQPSESCGALGLSEECTFGPNTGTCSRGTKFCWGDYWGPCQGEVLPVAEVCDHKDNDCDGDIDESLINRCGSCGEEPQEVCDTKDNDCDGLIDEGFLGNAELCDGEDNDCDGSVDEGLSKRYQCEPPWFQGNLDYSSGSGCTLGFKECRNGSWTDCLGWRGPVTEICNGVDDDCNGVSDDNIPRTPCGVSDVGECQYGSNFCVDSETICVGSTPPQNEICDNVDNDCDQQIDESLTRECFTSCGYGVETCSAGSWVSCTARAPTEDVCDGDDNDCDGQVDEGLSCPCELDSIRPCLAYPCGWGFQTCLGGQEWSACTGDISQPEICNNHDDNCNTEVDEDLEVICYSGPEDSIGVGICLSGVSTCQEGVWGVCEGQVTPGDEVCDGVDNNCDGLTDNMDRYFEKADIMFVIDVSGSMSTYINPLVEKLSEYVSVIQGTEHRFGVTVFGHRGLQSGQSGYPLLEVPLSDVGSFVSGLNDLRLTGGLEPSLDAVVDVAHPSNPLGISWRPDATPIIILVGDEQAQTNRLMSWSYAQEVLSECNLPGCSSETNESWVDGDPVEVYAFLRPMFFSPWTTVIHQGESRVFNIQRMIDSDSLDVDLQLVFSDVCIEW